SNSVCQHWLLLYRERSVPSGSVEISDAAECPSPSSWLEPTLSIDSVRSSEMASSGESRTCSSLISALSAGTSIKLSCSSSCCSSCSVEGSSLSRNPAAASAVALPKRLSNSRNTPIETSNPPLLVLGSNGPRLLLFQAAPFFQRYGLRLAPAQHVME